MSRSRFSKLVSVVITGVIAISGLPSMVLADVINSPTYYSVQSELDYEITTNITSSWINHESIDLVLTNTGIDTIHNWHLTFNTPYNIENIWNGTIYETDGNGTYTITSNGWNQDIRTGESVTVGITFSSDTETELSIDPEWYLLNTQATVVDASQYTLAYTEYSAWETGFTGQLTLTPQVDCQHWELSFASNREITAVSSAVLIPEDDNNYAITHDENNMRLFASNAYNFGIQGVSTEAPLELSNVELTVVDLAYHLTDDVDANGVPDYIEFIGGGSIVDPTPTPTPTVTPSSIPTQVQHDPQYPIIDFYVSKPELNVGDADSTVCFYLLSDVLINEVNVSDSMGNVVTTLFDNGNYTNNMDDIMGDGVYSGKLEVDTSLQSEEIYSVQLELNGEVYSASTSICVYPVFTEMNNNELCSVMASVRSMLESDEYLLSDIHQRKELMISLLSELAVNGTDEFSYSLIDSNTITFEESSNIVSFYMYFNCPVEIELNTYDEVCASGSQSQSRYHIEDDYDGDVLILYSYDDYYESGVSGYENMITSVEDAGYTAAIDYNFTVQDLRTILDNRKAIVFATHGWANSNGDPRINVYQDYEINNRWTNNDIRSGRMTVRSDGYNIYPSFFPFYWRTKLDDSLVLFGSCESAGNTSNLNYGLGESMEICGASATVAMQGVVYIGYCEDYYTSVLSYYLNYNTVGYSCRESTLDVAENDVEWFLEGGYSGDPRNSPATPQVYGDENYHIPRSCIVNGSFNNTIPSLDCWEANGDVRTVIHLGTIWPTDGMGMALLTTGIGSGEFHYLNGNNESLLSQYINLTSTNSAILSFDCNFLSEEPLEFIGSRFDDTFAVCLQIESDGHVDSIPVYINSVNQANWTRIYSVDFDGGDSTCYETGWLHIVVDLSQYDKINGVVFAITDIGDSRYDSAVLIDNVSIN